jgi:hypothetical protein
MLLMIKWFKKLSKGGKTAVIVGAFTLLAVISPSSDTLNSSTIPTDTNQPSQQVIDTSAKQPISTTETKTETKTESVAYESVTKNDSSIENGRSIKSVTGINGERTITQEVTYTNGVESGRKEISNVITKNPVNEVILLGTKVAPKYVAPAPKPTSNCDPNYTPCVPNTSSDLDCPDIGFMVQVLGNDPHRFDGDNDGYGCESYN